jgi:phosphoglycolate phosphatase-like HAD superfamily hydrolase
MAGNLILQMIAIVQNHQFPAHFLDELRQVTRTSIFWNDVMDFLDRSHVTQKEAATVRNELDEVLIRHEHDDHQESYLPDEATPFLRALIHEGFRMVMLTNTSRRELDDIFLKYDLATFFIDSITRDDVRKMKPDVEGVIQVLDKFGEDSFAIVDDLDYGVMVTREAEKMGYRGFAILVDRQKYSQAQLKQLCPDAIVTTLQEIPNLLKTVIH